MSKWMRSSFPSWSESYVDWTQPSPRIQSAVLAENTFCESPLTNVGSAAPATPTPVVATIALSPAASALHPLILLPPLESLTQRRSNSPQSALTSCRCLKLGESHLHTADELRHPARLGLAQRLLEQRARPLALAAGQEQLGELAPHQRDHRPQPADGVAAQPGDEMRLGPVELAHGGGEQRQEAMRRAHARGLADLHELAGVRFEQAIEDGRLLGVADKRARLAQQRDRREPEQIARDRGELVPRQRPE